MERPSNTLLDLLSTISDQGRADAPGLDACTVRNPQLDCRTMESRTGFEAFIGDRPTAWDDSARLALALDLLLLLPR